MTARLSCSLCDTPVQEGPPAFPHLSLSAIRTPHPLQISALPFDSSVLRPVTLRRQLRCLRAVQGEDGVFRELLLPCFLPFTSQLREEVQVFRNRPSSSRCWHRASDLRQRQHKSNSCIQHWGKTQIIPSSKHLTRLCQALMLPTYLPGVRSHRCKEIKVLLQAAGPAVWNSGGHGSICKRQSCDGCSHRWPPGQAGSLHICHSTQ